MRSTTVLLAALLAVFAASLAQAQTLGGPILGFVPNGGGTTLSPVMGVPGASILSSPLDFEASLSNITVSPTQDYALALTPDARVVFIDLSGSAPAIRMTFEINGSVLGISPSGSSAAVYDPGSKNIQVITGLPKAPALARILGASRADSEISGVTVSDDGYVSLVKSDGAMWVVDAQSVWQIPAGRPSAAAFFPHRRDLVFTDDTTHSAFLLTDAGRSNNLMLLTWAGDTETLVGASVSDDGRRVFLATASGSIAVVETVTRATVKVSCGCTPTGLNRLKGSAVFRLTEPSNEPILVLDATSSQPRVVLIPPRAAQ